MQFDIDVHVLTLENQNEKWFEQCLNSLENQPINGHIMPGTPGDIWEGRMRGYRTGTAKYVAFVDPDDIVVSGGFEACQETLEANPDLVGAYTCSRKLRGDKDTRFTKTLIEPHTWSREMMEKRLCVHQLCVLRRDVVVDALDTFYGATPNPVLEKTKARGRYDKMFFKLLTLYGDYLNVHVQGYIWRKHDGQFHDSPATIRARYETPAQRAFTKAVEHNILFNKTVSA